MKFRRNADRDGWRHVVGTLLCLCVVSTAVEAQPAGTSAPATGLRFRVERAATERAKFAEQAFVDGQLAVILERLESLRRDPLVPSGDGVIAGRLAAETLFRRLSAVQQRDVSQARELAARQAWERWERDPTQAGLLNWLEAYESTSLGLQGWLTWARWARDDGLWLETVLAWDRAANHKQAGPAVWRDISRGIHEQRLWLTHPAVDDLAALVSTRLGERPSPGVAAAPIPMSTTIEGAGWSVAPAWPEGIAEAWLTWLEELRGHGVVPWSVAHPVVTGDKVLVRTWNKLLALRRSDGSEAWHVPDAAWAWLERSTEPLPHAGTRQNVLDSLGRLMLADSRAGRVVVDAERVFLLQTYTTGQDPLGPFGPWPVSAQPEDPSVPPNNLTAYDLKTGELRWRIGGASAGPTYAYEQLFFCGPPLVIDRTLYVLGQQRLELQLLAIDAKHGGLLWRLPLGDLPRPLGLDPARQRIGCTPILVEGRLVCPTAAGAVVTVDPLLRRVDWGQRYGVTVREAGPRSRGESTPYVPDAWWDGWREAAVLSRGERIAVVAPETDTLAVFEPASGQPVWSAPRDEGLTLADGGVHGCLVLTAAGVRCHAWDDGALRWRVVLPESVTGRGVVRGARLEVPLESGAIAALSLETGKLEALWLGAGTDLGNLSAIEEGWVSTSWSTVRGVTTTDGTAADVVAGATPAAGWLTASDYPAAIDRWMSRPEGPERTARLRQLWRWRIAADPSAWSAGYAALSQLTTDPLERFADQLMLLREGLRSVDVAAVTEAWLALEPGLPLVGMVAEGNPGRLIRPDLAWVGLGETLWRADEPEQTRVRPLLEAHWDQARTSSDPFALPRLAELWKSFRGTSTWLLSAEQDPFLGQSVLSTELRWLHGITSESDPTATAMEDRLTAELRATGFDDIAEDYARWFARRRGEHPSTPASSPWQAWGERPLEVERRRERNDQIYYFAAPWDAESGPFFDRLDLSVERQGRRLRFAGAGHAGSWDVALPAGTGSYRYLLGLVSAWGRGRVVVVRIGFELFGLAPVDERGEPAAKVLWHLDMLGGGAIAPERLRVEAIPAIPGLREEEFRVIDPFGRMVGQVGAVTHESLCYNERGVLVSIDLPTGLRRWARDDLPPGTVLTGDHEVVVLWQPERRRVEWLRASDGSTLGGRDCHLNADEVWQLAGRRALTLTPRAAGPQPRVLTCHDLVTGDVVWRYEGAAGMAPIPLDDQTVGLLEPAGRMVRLHRATGRVLGETPLTDGPAELDHVTAARDAGTWYVAASSRVTQQAGLQQAQVRSGYRSPFFEGPLVAIDRQTGQVLWQRRLEREPFSPDQPRSLPVLMQLHKEPPKDLGAGQITDGVLRLIDKRTGEVWLDHRGPELIGYAAVTATRGRETLDVALERETLRLHFRPRPPAPAMPMTP